MLLKAFKELQSFKEHQKETKRNKRDGRGTHVIPPELAAIQLILLRQLHVLLHGVQLGAAPVEDAHQRVLPHLLKASRSLL